MNLRADLPRLEVSQGRLFHVLRWKIIRNAGMLIYGNSRMKLFTALGVSLVVWAFVFFVAYWGFGVLAGSRIPFAGGIVGLLFDSMFFTLGSMLVFSTGLILYASLFTGAETRFLLTTPARADHIFAMKFQSAIAFSSWAFLVLGAPILIAYGVSFDVPWHYYVLMPIFFLGYIILPGSLGAVICLLIVNFFPKQRKQALGIVIAACAFIGAFWIYGVVVAARNSANNRDALQDLFDMFMLANGKLSPSHWITQGLLALARGDVASSLFPLALLWSNGLFLYVLTTWLSKRLYRRGFNRMTTGGDLRRRYGTVWIDKLMNMLVFYLDKQTRLLIIKDFRTFRREPAQIGQIGLFVGLILLCVVNFRQFFRADLPTLNQYMVSLLNLGATGLLMCAFLGRFIFPLISLEGRKFWILGLLPLKREKLMWGKFAFALTGSTLFGTTLVLMSDLVLGVDATAVVIHLVTINMAAFGLTGLSVGLGAWIPNFRETDPSKIVVGFGGTVNMIISLMYLILLMAMMIVPLHTITTSQAFTGSVRGFPIWGILSMIGGIILTILAVWLPMRAGIQSLQRMEF